MTIIRLVGLDRLTSFQSRRKTYRAASSVKKNRTKSKSKRRRVRLASISVDVESFRFAGVTIIETELNQIEKEILDTEDKQEYGKVKHRQKLKQLVKVGRLIGFIDVQFESTSSLVFSTEGRSIERIHPTTKNNSSLKILNNQPTSKTNRFNRTTNLESVVFSSAKITLTPTKKTSN